MIDELPRVGVLTGVWRVQEFRYTEVGIDIVAHCRFVMYWIDFGMVEERGSAGHVGVVGGDVHSCHGRCEVERCRR